MTIVTRKKKHTYACLSNKTQCILFKSHVTIRYNIVDWLCRTMEGTVIVLKQRKEMHERSGTTRYLMANCCQTRGPCPALADHRPSTVPQEDQE